MVKSKLMYEVGDLVEIAKYIHGHDFKIGSKVKIEELYENQNPPHYRASCNGDIWYILDEEINHEKGEKNNMKKTIYPATLLCDFYKLAHREQYPEGTEKVYSTWIPRSNKYFPKADKVVVFGIQSFIKKYLIDYFNEQFFNRPLEDVLAEYNRYVKHTLGSTPCAKHIEELHNLGYLPIKIKALKEGTETPIRVPMLTIENTDSKFFWLTNYLETIVSNEIWLPMTSATIAKTYRKLLDEYAIKTVGTTDGVEFQGHDFSMRGMGAFEASVASGAGHLLPFVGTDTIPSIVYLEEYYNANVEKEMVGTSIPATEHSVMCAYGETDEFELFKHLMTNVYPSGFFSVVSDTWDFWKVVGEYLPKLKDTVLARDGRVVIRPDSGNPVDILCGEEIDSFELYGTDSDSIECKDYSELRDILFDVWFDSKNSDRDTGVGNFKFNVKTTDGKFYNVKADILNFEHYEVSVIGEVKYEVEKIEVNELVQKGLIEALWDIFGGTITPQGYKLLDPHIGAIYGDSITIERAEEICKRLEAKGFASTNVVFGIGSYTYQYNTRDTFGFAMKATYAVVNGEERMLFKDPKTDDGTKKSLKGLVAVTKVGDELHAVDGLNQHSYDVSFSRIDQLEVVFENGKLLRDQSLAEIREILKG